MPLMPLMLSPSVPKCSAHLRHPAKPGRLRLGKAGSAGKDGRPSKPVKVIPEGFSWHQNHRKITRPGTKRKTTLSKRMCSLVIPGWPGVTSWNVRLEALSCWTVFTKTKTLSWLSWLVRWVWSCWGYAFAAGNACLQQDQMWFLIMHGCMAHSCWDIVSWSLGGNPRAFHLYLLHPFAITFYWRLLCCAMFCPLVHPPSFSSHAFLLDFQGGPVC